MIHHFITILAAANLKEISLDSSGPSPFYSSQQRIGAAPRESVWIKIKFFPLARVFLAYPPKMQYNDWQEGFLKALSISLSLSLHSNLSGSRSTIQ